VLRHESAQLQNNPTRIPQEEAVRAAHTLAGISGTAGFEPTQTLGRALEHALARLCATGTPPTAEQTALLSTASTTMDAMIGEIRNGSLPLSAPVLEAQLDSLLRTPIVTDEPTELDETLPEEAIDLSELAPPSLESAPGIEPVQESAPEAKAKAAPETHDVQDDIDEQLLPIFIEEALDLLAQLNGTMREWRNDTANEDHHAAVARLLHTIKGSSRMTGAMSLGERLHALEGQLEAAKTITPELLDELEQGLDITSQYVDRLARGETSPMLEQPADAAVATETTAGEPAAAAPMAPAAVTIEADEGTGTAGGTLRVRADLVDRFVNEAGEIGIARTRVEGELRTQRRALLDLTENVIRLRNQLREVEIQADIQMQSRMAQAESQHANFDPLEMDRYTRLQELTRMMAESVNDVTTVQHALLRNLDQADAALVAQSRQTRTLQQALMSVRMTPFDSLADRLYRVVRQSAKDLGKRANLDLRGGRIELDRSVLERITGPLEHLLRNAVAHGIESPDMRRESRKPDLGQITLNVRHEGNEVVVEMMDDGAGLNFERIEARAREAGLIGPDEAVDERRLTNMIFMPGFSTAGELSAISGRGVGMDVVKSETAAVGGRIEVTSTAGVGSTFRLYLPLTLAVTQALLVRAGGRTFAIPSNMVAQVLELKADALADIQAAGTTHWLGNDYSYTYLPRLLGDNETQPEVHRFNWVLLLRSGTQTLAVHVDALRGNQEIVVKKAGPQLARLVGYTGATVLGDGEIVLIINPVALAGVAGDIAASGHAGIAPMTETAHTPTVMVVDDSLTVRKITSRLLEREGYTVVTAKDGVDALEQLLEDIPDVILSDIEMPRMDGFDLARNIRNDVRLKAVPIIMITSRLADKHREYAAQIGVNHYLGKPYQEDELLALIGEYAPAPH
jgi:chemosensory pili system protein ChpA (sensor histidine kinase/response regulator)